MTDDLVSRLRAGLWYSDYDTVDDEGVDALMARAADEIERLRDVEGELAACTEDYMQLWAIVADLAALPMKDACTCGARSADFGQVWRNNPTNHAEKCLWARACEAIKETP